MSTPSTSLDAGRSPGILGAIERVGNRLPNITILFFYALCVAALASWLLSYISFDYINPVSGEQIQIKNMLAPSELLALSQSLVKNFVTFPPLGIVIVATLGIGIAEGAGYLRTLLKQLLAITPQRFVTPSVIFVGVVSHVAADSAYVFLMPIAAFMFYASGKHPLAGIAAAFAGLAGGFAASFTPSSIDPIMQGFTQGAARIIDPNYAVNVLCNYFISFGSTFGVIGVCWYITDKIVEPRLQKFMPIDNQPEGEDEGSLQSVTPLEAKAFRAANYVMLAMAIGLVLLLYPVDSMLRAPDGSMTSPQAPIMQIIVPLLFIFFAVPGIVYGFIAGTFKDTSQITKSMENVVITLIGFIVFCFFCAQFLYVFGQSQIGALIAMSGAEFLKSIDLPPQVTILGIIFLTACLNILITSASSKWAILAPVFIPMLMAVGISPELTQASFRISDSAINVSTPLFSFYPLIIMYCQRYCTKTGVGTLVSMMVPYTVGLLVVMTITLYLFWALGIPLGFDSGYVYPAV
ncbi:AbgT family transporter [Rhodobacteraceae bacterium RKSG542]|uniref:AbgT family transporter n=1 Tax=Pseudovibrio flavus TaxID=2529854 RepID=UPI0012BC6376|nr:AbgT family transporter [Pseudovibrio flavus]MTI16271.1 AbgT family transporter [Pseudovibrio flavus]